MSTYVRPKTPSQIRHSASRSQSHLIDKQQGEKRRELEWVSVGAPERGQAPRSFAPLQGHEYTFDGSQWLRCSDPEEYADYLEAKSAKLGWYMSQTTRNGAPVPMKRRSQAFVILTTTLSPWLANWIFDELTAGRDPSPHLAAIRNSWLQWAQKHLSGQRYFIGYSFHCDTSATPHFDLALSRQDGKGGRIGKPGLMLCGPWCVGVDRQIRSGATILAEKKNQLQRSAANFKNRYGVDAKPLDILLARTLDAVAEKVLGPKLSPYREAYAASVPELERTHTEARLAVLDAARAKLLQQAPPESGPSQTSAPEALPDFESDHPSIGR